MQNIRIGRSLRGWIKAPTPSQTDPISTSLFPDANECRHCEVSVVAMRETILRPALICSLATRRSSATIIVARAFFFFKYKNSHTTRNKIESTFAVDGFKKVSAHSITSNICNNERGRGTFSGFAV